RLYVGNYTAFERQRAEQLRQQQIQHEKVQAERAHLQSFIDRFKASAAKAAQAQSRVARLATLADAAAVRAAPGEPIVVAAPARRTRSSSATPTSAWRRATASACGGRTAPASRPW